jgi:hypothetical protein
MNNCEEELRLARERIKELEENDIAFPLRLYLALKDILDKDKSFHKPDNLELNVYDIGFEINKEISINPKDLICILTPTNQNFKGNNGRKKILFTKEENKNIKVYLLNNNSLSFKKLLNQLDPLNHYLVIVSKNTIANVKFYDLVKDNELKINLNGELPDEIKKLSISNSKAHSTTVENFNKIKEAYDYRISLQKKVFGYKYAHGIDT